MADVRLQLIIQAIDQAGNILRNIKTQVDTVGASAKATGAEGGDMGNRLAAGLSKASQAADDAQKRLTSIGSTMTEAGLALTGLGASMSAPFVLGVKAAGAYEHQINTIKAVVDKITSEQLANVQKITRDISATSQFGPTEAAEGMVQLAKAGYDVAQQSAAIVPVLQLAAAEGRRTGETAEDLVNIVGAFGLGAEGASRAADILAKTSNETTTSMAELAQGLKFVGPLAKSIGMSFEEVNAYLGIFSNNGIKGAMAGTALRGMIARLSDPTNEAKTALAAMNVEIVKNKDGSVNLGPTFQKLHDAGMTGAQAMSIFGQEASSAATIIATQGDKIQELTQKNYDAQGSLKAFSDTVNSGLVASFDKFTASVQRLLIALGSPFLDVLTKLLQGISWIVNGLSSFAEQHTMIAGVVGGVVAVIGLLLAGFGAIVTVFGLAAIAAAALTNGWRALLQAKQSGLKITEIVTNALRLENKAINENTAAIERQAAARKAIDDASLSTSRRQAAINQQKIDEALISYAGRGAPQMRQTPVPQAGSGSGYSLRDFSALTDGGMKATIAVTALTTAMNAYTTGVDKAGAPTANLISNAGSLTTSFLMLPPHMAIISAGITSWIEVIPQLGEAFSFLSQDIKDAFGSLPEWLQSTLKTLFPVIDAVKWAAEKIGSIGEKGSSPSAITPEKNAAFAQDFVLQEIGKKGGVGSAGINYRGIVEEFKKAFGDKALTEDLEKALSRAYFNATQNYKKEMAKVGNELTSFVSTTNNAFTEAASKYLTIDDKLKAIREAQDSLRDATKEYYAALNQNTEVALADIKNQIIATSQSTEVAAVRIASVEAAASNQKIERARADYETQKSFRDAAYQAAIASLQDQMVKEKDNAAKLEQLKAKQVDLDKAYREQSKADEKAYRDSIIAEIKREEDALKNLQEARQKLVQQIKDESVDAAKSQQTFTEKTLSETDRLKSGLSQVYGDIQRARDLVNDAPEKAIEVFKSARSQAQSLAQDLHNLQQSMKSTKDKNTDILLDLYKKQVSPYEGWQIDLQRVIQLTEQAKQLQSEGKYKEAAEVAGQAASKAQGLANAPQGVDTQEAAQTAMQYTAQAIAVQEQNQQAALVQAKDMNDKAQSAAQAASEGIKSAQDRLLDLNSKQLDVHKNQLETLKAIAGALGVKEAPKVEGVSRATAPESKLPSAESTAQSVQSSKTQPGESYRTTADIEKQTKQTEQETANLQQEDAARLVTPQADLFPKDQTAALVDTGATQSFLDRIMSGADGLFSKLTSEAQSAAQPFMSPDPTRAEIPDDRFEKAFAILSSAVDKFAGSTDITSKLDINIRTDGGQITGAEVARAY